MVVTLLLQRHQTPHDLADFIFSQDYSRIGCDALYFVRWIPIFNRNRLLLCWIWRHQFCMKCYYPNVKVCGITS
jgi:hypothetical protein